MKYKCKGTERGCTARMEKESRRNVLDESGKDDYRTRKNTFSNTQLCKSKKRVEREEEVAKPPQRQA